MIQRNERRLNAMSPRIQMGGADTVEDVIKKLGEDIKRISEDLTQATQGIATTLSQVRTQPEENVFSYINSNTELTTKLNNTEEQLATIVETMSGVKNIEEKNLELRESGKTYYR